MKAKREWKNAVILGAARTPVAKAKGQFAPLRAEQLGAIALRAAVERSGIDPAEIEHVGFMLSLP